MLFCRIVNKCKIFGQNESGLTLLETLAATAIIGMVAVGLFGGMSVAARSDFIVTRLSSAEALARSQIEHIKNSSYIDYSDPDHGEYELIAIPDDYAINVNCSPVSPSTGQPLGPNEDSGIQLITVTVRHNGEQVIVLKGYKINR